MNLKNQRGSIALFVLIALLFYMGFLLLMYANNLNKVQTITEKLDIIKSIYAKNFEDIDDVYNRRLAQNDNTQPIIKEIPNKIITNVTPINDVYEEYGPTGGKAEYLAFEKKFASLKEVINYSIQNNLYGNTSIVINAYGNNGLITNGNKDIEIIRGMKVTNEAELNTAFATTGDLYVYIANNIACTNPITADNINQKLDLNNNEISYTKQNESFTFLTLGANANLTILDSSEGKGGNLVSKLLEENGPDNGSGRVNSIFTIRNEGTLTLDSGMISANCKQYIASQKKGTNIDDIATAIHNLGTCNLNGGKLNTNIDVKTHIYINYVGTIAKGRGIYNEGGIVSFNKGSSITVKTVSTTVKTLGVFGKAHAYAYGIENKGGTVNNNNDDSAFSVSAIADTPGALIIQEQANIKDVAKTVEETGE